VAGNSKDRRRSVISKASAILWAMTAGGLNTLTEITAPAGMPLSTVHRLAGELTAWGVLERDEAGHYGAGTPLRALCGGGASAEPEPVSRLRECAAPVMEDLFRVTGLPVRAGHLDGIEVAYIQKASADRPVSPFTAAARLPAYATAWQDPAGVLRARPGRCRHRVRTHALHGAHHHLPGPPALDTAHHPSEPRRRV
jgi:DNA-binding IclR family transcriptional regulator